MSGIKTGAPGFVNPVDGKVYTVDTGGSESPPVNPILDNPDPGDMTVDKTIKDISKDTRITLGKYLSETTKGKVGASKGVPNKYSVDASTPSTQQGTISDEKGFPLPLAPSQNSEKFVDNLPSSFSKNYPAIKEGFKKGKAEGKIPDGNSLLTDANDPASPIRPYVDNSIASNEFNPPAPFLPPEIDATNPKPATFEAKINDSNVLGNYSEAEKKPVTLNDMRHKASSVTSTNKFPVDGSDESLIPMTDPSTGFPTIINPTQTNESFFAKREDVKPLSNDPTITGFNKGKGSAPYDGNNLLKSVTGNLDVTSPEAKTAIYSSGQLTDAGSSALDSRGSIQTGDGIDSANPLNNYVGTRGGVLAAMALKSRWAPGVISGIGATFNGNLKLADGTEVSQLKMAVVGIGLTQRAAAEIPAWTADKFDPLGNGAELGAMLPSVAQLGILKVNNLLLQAKDVLLHLEDDVELDPAALTSISPFDGQSWGNLTSPAEPFDDPSSIGLIITMGILVLAITLLLELFINVKYEKVRTTADSGQRTLGSYKFVKDEVTTSESFSSLLSGLLGFVKTNNTFATAVGVGARFFFLGGDGTDLDAFDRIFKLTIGSLKDSFLGASAVGANLVVARTIIRSGLIMAQYFQDIFKRGTSSFTAGAKAALGIFKVIRSSKLVSTFNVFAGLGDVILDRKTRRGQTTTDPNGNPVDVSSFDAADATLIAHSTVRKSRLTKMPAGTPISSFFGVATPTTPIYDPTLAWSLQRAPSMYLVPKNIKRLQLLDNDQKNGLGSFKGVLGLSRNKARVKLYDPPSDNGRILSEHRINMEKILDAEYVPFYFHDVRTNEIVSFHAFLSSLTDDYSATYETVEGFGRVEPVKIYKGTTRKIGISFIIAATSADDFQHMWFKINKLTTLLYPQYTSGRTLVGDNYQFKAPFSQMIGSSPLIRIRLGDVLRSNYSKFALARLFGATDGDTTLPNTQTSETVNPGDAIKLDFSSENRTNLLKAEIKKITDTNAATVAAFKDKTSKEYIGKALDTNKLLSVINASPNSSSVVSITSATIKSIINNKTYNVKYEYVKTSVPPPDEGSPPPSPDVSTAELPFNISDLELSDLLDPNTVTMSPTAQASYGELTNFMNPNGNAIVKSFESAGGKGLAGMIESMNFDWYNQTTWGIDPDQTAPKMCKVTISFSPIHDISPGIDHQGYNRAPIYPVGSGMASFKK